jgi:ATP-dependent helicase/nuclease subunit B
MREFGKNPPLAVRIQVHAVRQRLEWFANEQAKTSEEGWEIIHIERKIAIPSGGFTVSGKIDRIDRHRETGQLRVIDYKTGKVSNIEGEHRKKITARTYLPSHIGEKEAPFQSGTDAKGKPADFLWRNLQLPLYALAESNDSNGEVPIPCYIHLGKTKENVGFTTWDTFSEEDLESAKSCMDWITSRIAQRAFWPPAEKVDYDDYSLLSQDAPLEEAFMKP